LETGAEITIGATRLVLFVGEDDGVAQSTDPGVTENQLHIAWLLDEELVEEDKGVETTRSDADVIGQDLRIPPGLQAALEVVSGEDKGQCYRFSKGNITIGRRFGAVPLADTEVSRRHAVLEIFGREMVFLRDLGSTNGTYHNGRRVTVSRLVDGDTIGCGKTVMRLQLTQ